MPSLVLGLFLLDDKRVGGGIAVLPGAGELPADLHAGDAAGDSEAVGTQLLGDVQPGRGGADRGELVAHVPVERLEPGG